MAIKTKFNTALTLHSTVAVRKAWGLRGPRYVKAPMILALLLFISVSQSTAQDRAALANGTTPPLPTRFFEAPKSGASFASEEIRKLQADEFGNPALLLLDQARQNWQQVPINTGSKSCADCHGAVETLKGAATRYPKLVEKLGLVNLEGRINACRSQHQGQAPWPYESEPLLGMSALVATQSRGLSAEVVINTPTRPYFDAGQALYYQRMGQMNLACHHCHEQNAGRRLLAEVISQGHGNAYPIYRLEWQATGSLHRRFRSCLNGVKAELWLQGSPEFLNLELFLAWRANGLPIETPGVRR